jgi:hypothetical protein
MRLDTFKYIICNTIWTKYLGYIRIYKHVQVEKQLLTKICIKLNMLRYFTT